MPSYPSSKRTYGTWFTRLWSAARARTQGLKPQPFLVLLALLLGIGAPSCGLNDCGTCPDLYSPVCGSDGLTYANACEADCAGVDHSEGTCPEWADAWVIDTGPVALDGCGYVLELAGDAGSGYNFRFPRNLDSIWWEDSLPIRVEYQTTTHIYQCGLGTVTMPVVDILSCEYR